MRRRGGLVFSSKGAFFLQFSYGFDDYPIGEDIQIVDKNFYIRFSRPEPSATSEILFFLYICYMIGAVARQLYIHSNTNACLSIAFQENAKNYYFVNSTKPALHGVTFCIYIYMYV